MPISQKQYQIMTKKASPGSKSWIDIPSAFVIGGLICTVGEYLLNTFKNNGFDTKTAGAWTSVTLVFLSALLTGLGLYEKIAKHGERARLFRLPASQMQLFRPRSNLSQRGLF